KRHQSQVRSHPRVMFFYGLEAPKNGRPLLGRSVTLRDTVFPANRPSQPMRIEAAPESFFGFRKSSSRFDIEWVSPSRLRPLASVSSPPAASVGKPRFVAANRIVASPPRAPPSGGGGALARAPPPRGGRAERLHPACALSSVVQRCGGAPRGHRPTGARHARR